MQYDHAGLYIGAKEDECFDSLYYRTPRSFYSILVELSLIFGRLASGTQPLGGRPGPMSRPSINPSSEITLVILLEFVPSGERLPVKLSDTIREVFPEIFVPGI